tara:strand:+ start:312 stop:1448 length:1137 start_codon:yes stop_codon:yes gene_type:complete
MQNLRSKFLIDSDITYLNHGSYGSCPKIIFEEYQKWQRILENQPVRFFTDKLYRALNDSRISLSKFIGCNQNEVLFFSNPTTAITNIIYNLNIEKGDEILMTDHEYGALIRAWNAWSNKSGAKIIQQKIPVPVNSKKKFIDTFWRGVTKKTKIIFISHITSPTALIFPVKEIIKKAKKKGILTIVDGAHTPGHIDINMDNLGCDFYTGALHKWLCMPKGSAFLYVKRKHQEWVKPIVYSWGKDGDDPGPTEFLQNFQWQGTRDMSSFLTVPISIDFYYKYIHQLKDKCRKINQEIYERFGEILNTKPISSGGKWLGQMVSHPLPKKVPKDIKKILLENHNIEIPIFQWKDLNLIRSSIQIYNQKKDVESLMKALGSII